MIVGDTGMGQYYVLDTAHRDSDGESPVVIWGRGKTAPTWRSWLRTSARSSGRSSKKNWALLDGSAPMYSASAQLALWSACSDRD